MTSTLESTEPLPMKAVRRAAVVTHGHVETIGPALERLDALARQHGVELVFSVDERVKHQLEPPVEGDPLEADIAIVLGGDGTMLRALARFLNSGIPVFGVNFGRVGFLASTEGHALESGLARVFRGEYRVVELPTLEAEVDGQQFVALNDVVVTSSTLGRMVELEWAVGAENLGRIPCDGMICSTPTGSTAYNLSNGGPVLVRGLEAMAVTFVAPHSLHARPLVVPRGLDVEIWNRANGIEVTVIVDGHISASLAESLRAVVRLGNERSLLATLPETTFFTRYRATFGS
jgi:NAD+ kinase